MGNEGGAVQHPANHPTLLAQLHCPSCGGKYLVRHCDTSPSCDLAQCAACKSSGTPDGRRWIDRSEQAA